MDLLTEKTGRLFRKYLIPSLLSAAAVSIFQLVDMVAIGQGVGPDGVAALAIVTPLFGVASFLGLFIGIGGSVHMGIAGGEGNREKYYANFTVSLILMSASSLLLWAGFSLFSEPVYLFFGANERLLPLVKEYGNWIIGCFPAFFFSIYMGCIVRADGAPDVALWAVMVSGLFNVCGDYLLVFPLKVGTGMAGAAIATVLGNAIQVVIYIGYFISRKCDLRLVKPNHWLRGIKKVIAAGISAGFVDIAYISLTILLNNQVMKYGGEAAMAVFGVAYTCISTFQRVYDGVGQAAQPIISTNYGGKQYSRIFELLRYSIIAEIILSAASALTGILFPKQVTTLFMETTPELLRLAPSIIRPVFVSVLFAGIGHFAVYYLQSIMKSALATVIAMLRGIVLTGILVILLPCIMGLRGIWDGLILAEFFTMLLAIYYFYRTSKQLSGYGQATTAEDHAGETALMQSKEGVIITIAREHGSCGKQIGRIVAQRLGIPFYDKDMAALAAQESGLDREFMSNMDTDLAQHLHSLYRSTTVIRQAVRAQYQIIRKIADCGSCVIVGRAADYVLRDDKNIVRIFIYAPKDYRVEQVMEIYGDSRDEAERNIRRSDAARSSYYQAVSDRIWGDMGNYELMVDSSIGIHASADVICKYVEKRTGNA
ncbi:MAG: cytidylate kinase family protein [Eubacteriales bacterium]|nr:cytidylate kinase family protein [Eubacteriales bacterium]